MFEVRFARSNLQICLLSFLRMRLANVSETFSFRLGVRIDATLGIESAGSRQFPDFSMLIILCQPKGKKDAPLRALRGRIAMHTRRKEYVLL